MHALLNVKFARVDFPTAVLLKTLVFWGVTPRQLLNSFRRFEGFYFFRNVGNQFSSRHG
jgi:hypothetical protein